MFHVITPLATFEKCMKLVPFCRSFLTGFRMKGVSSWRWGKEWKRKRRRTGDSGRRPFPRVFFFQ
jgi:hypothetical protein